MDNVHQRTLIREWNDIGNELLTQKRWDEALDAFNKVLSTDNTNLRAFKGKAVATFMLNNFQAAIDCYERILDLGEATSLVFLGRGVTRCHMDQYDEALDDFKQVRRLDVAENSPSFWSELGNDIDNYGPKSIGLFRRALKDFPNEASLYDALSCCYLYVGKYDEARECIRRAVEMEPNNTNFQYTLGKVEYGLGNWKQASLAFDQCIRAGTMKHEERLLLFKIDAEYKMGNYDEMERTYYTAFEWGFTQNERTLNNATALANTLYRSCNAPERAIKLLQKVMSFENNKYSSTVNLLAQIYSETEQHDEAVKLLKKIHEHNPNDLQAKFHYATLLEPADALPYFEALAQGENATAALLNLAGTYLKLGQYEKSIKVYDKIIAANNSWFAHQMQAKCYLRLKDYAKETQAMLHLCELMDDEPNKYFAALPPFIRWQYNEALRVIDDFIAKHPEVFDGWNIRSTILKEMGREVEALESIDKAIEMDSHYSVLYQKLDILAAFGRFDEANELAKQLEADLPKTFDGQSVVFYITLSVLLRRQGKYDESLACVNKSIENMDKVEYPDVFRFQYWVEKAKVLEEMKRTDEAISSYEYALSIYPQEPHSLLHLAMLYRECGRETEARALVPRLAALKTDVKSFNKEVAELLTQLK